MKCKSLQSEFISPQRTCEWTEVNAEDEFISRWLREDGETSHSWARASHAACVIWLWGKVEGRWWLWFSWLPAESNLFYGLGGRKCVWWCLCTVYNLPIKRWWNLALQHLCGFSASRCKNLSGYANDRCLLINLPLKYEHHHIAARDENLQEPSMYLWVWYCHLQAKKKKQCQLLVDGQANHIVHLNFDTHVNPLLTPGLSVLISPRDQIQMFRREEHAFTTCTSH